MCGCTGQINNCNCNECSLITVPSIVGPAGPAGPAGANGAAGAPGPAGPQGPQGIPGTTVLEVNYSSGIGQELFSALPEVIDYCTVFGGLITQVGDKIKLEGYLEVNEPRNVGDSVRITIGMSNIAPTIGAAFLGTVICEFTTQFSLEGVEGTLQPMIRYDFDIIAASALNNVLTIGEIYRYKSLDPGNVTLDLSGPISGGVSAMTAIVGSIPTALPFTMSSSFYIYIQAEYIPLAPTAFSVSVASRLMTIERKKYLVP